MQRKYGLAKGCFQNEWNFKVEILAWEARVVHISASVAMAEAIGHTGGSRGRFTSDLSLLQWCTSETFHEGSFVTNVSDNEGISAKAFFFMEAKTRWVSLGLTFVKPWSWPSTNFVATCPAVFSFEKSLLLLCAFTSYYIPLKKENDQSVGLEKCANTAREFQNEPANYCFGITFCLV